MSDVIKECEVKMQKAVEMIKKNLAGVRAGRASPALLDTIQVEYYGSNVPLKQMAQVAAPEPRMLVVTPYDKNAIQSIEKAIMASDLGITPRTEAGIIRLTLPELSEERRKELLKVIKKEAEEGKVAVRNIRRDNLELLKKQKAEKAITEDEEKSKDKKVQELTDKQTAEIDKLVALKEKEIMEV
ncbi:ribosome recycling factor [candidate division WOR-1 bacterium RIFOXYB2_FULL_48_7]|uniref:Ribosome-recycling factor n=1 Tax=candidate division WOR-1 bacterium RIFOXYB2_FULL_48_7 TaxID=1802583 RepID=A0A1F4TUK6_UNCSA|nr:MAG: ribosome recycling factor [candidate division WOR-1 bacterium RIFOXYB2_FULL_48_7]